MIPKLQLLEFFEKRDMVFRQDFVAESEMKYDAVHRRFNRLRREGVFEPMAIEYGY